ncbi:fasciclin-3 [Danaus plexippus plexippus]|uniref:Fasciclin-3 n=1 Tax=Danaus plexippus plexippus TaxID=278856 RepID=A0A212F5U3_DANPL|nr:fasciclin-3 [Danaus plexippus plexippus]
MYVTCPVWRRGRGGEGERVAIRTSDVTRILDPKGISGVSSTGTEHGMPLPGGASANGFGYVAYRRILESQLVDISPREAVRRVGDDLTVFCKVPYPIDSCRVTVGTTSYRLIPNNQEEEVTYSGQGLEAGECGAHIKHVREEWNGNISCTLPPQTGSIELSASMRLLVAKAPGVPQLVSPPQPTFREGDGFVAQCIVPDGRPAAKITWYFGKFILYDRLFVLRDTHE